MRSVAGLSILVAAALLASACQAPENQSERTLHAVRTAENTVVADKAFASGGRIVMDLDGGEYTVRPATDDRIRVTLAGNVGTSKIEVTADGARADVNVHDTPNNFKATIEVPKTADLALHFKGGDLTVAPIVGNKEVESYGGEIKIGVGNPDDYASVDASVKAGEITAEPFGGSKSGLLQHFTWSGHGKYTIRATLGAGNLRLRSE